MDKIKNLLILLLVGYVLYDLFIATPQLEQLLTNKIEEAINIEDEEGPELAVYMNYLQLYMNKLWFAGSNGNFELAAFYAHELEEVAEELVESEIIDDGYNISQLIKQMLLPAIEEVETAIKEENVALFKDGYTLAVNSCNACHNVTKHAFIKISTPKTPVFDNQVYEKP
jgi:hypothetical protein